MNYVHPPHRIIEILNNDKCLSEADALELQSMPKSKKGRHFDTRPELIDGPFVDMRYLGKAPVLADTTTYDASFLLAGQRVRGVGYARLARNNLRFKQRIQKGWHLNVCDPNLPTNDPKQNQHQPLPDFAPTDFRNFIDRTAAMWKIYLGWQWETDLFS